jgi:hypothetical protein
MVYIAEAHARDEWPISEAPRDFAQHVTLEDRLAAARCLLADFELADELAHNCFADGVDNAFDAAYASWPCVRSRCCRRRLVCRWSWMP